MRLFDWVLGRRLATSEEEAHKVGVWSGVAMLGLDALGSSAYGPEAALTVLIPLGAVASGYALPIIGLITGLLLVVFASYRQTIAAYPNGGGSYTVARENLGPRPGVIAAAALILDYILNAAVGISAGVGALVSAAPALLPHRLALCLGILVLITLLNLRGARESGGAMAVPTTIFLGSMLTVLAIGVGKALFAGFHPVSLVDLPRHEHAARAVGAWILVRAFASGCTAMTGVEAVSNGVLAFNEPKVKNAERTLTVLVIALAILLIGIGFLTRVYGIVATRPDASNYQSVLSLVVGAVVGRNWFYYVTLYSSLAVLALSANTSFADFPRLCHLLANDGYLPPAFGNIGRRLVFSMGIIVLAALSAILLVVFRGVTDRLIPLFAIGALLAFTMSQSGMVVHWSKEGQAHGPKRAVNLFGAVCTAAALVVVLVAKFVEGAWISTLLIAGMIWLFFSVNRHYRMISREIDTDDLFDSTQPAPPVVIVPMTSWTRATAEALRFAFSISPDVEAMHVSLDEQEEKSVCDHWLEHVATPFSSAGRKPPHLELIRSPYRRFTKPLLQFMLRMKGSHPDRTVAVVIPELVEPKWYQYILHSHRAMLIKMALLFRGGRGIVVISVPWYLKQDSAGNGTPATTFDS